MTNQTKFEELSEGELDQVTGGIALLLPAVQQARESSLASNEPASTTQASRPGIRKFGNVTLKRG